MAEKLLEKSIDELINDLQSDNVYFREQAIFELSRLDDQRISQILIEATNDTITAIRLTAVGMIASRLYTGQVISTIETSYYFDSLVQLLDDEDTTVREVAIAALGLSRDVRAVDPLIALLSSNDPFIRSNVVSALSLIRDSRVVEPLINSLHDKDPGVRWCAASALGDIDDSRVIETLINSLDDSGQLYPRGIETVNRMPVGQIAQKSLEKIGEAAIESLIKAQDHSNPGIRLRVRDILSKLGHSPITSH